MTAEANSTSPSPRFLSPALFGVWRSERSLPWIMGSVALIAFWFLRREYYGVWHDARIYMGRGLADLDPQGVGSDLFYRFDGQSSFSVFSKIVDALIPALGFANSALFLTVASLLLWLAALAALARQLATGRLKWGILICVAASTGSYGAQGLLHYAEAFATPRPFAEAGVLAAFAALLAGRKLTATLLLLLAGLFHPIMALAGVGTFYFYLCAEDRRWIYLGVVGGVAVVLAALLGAPLVSRLTQVFDWNWIVLLRLRSTYLFPTTWASTDWTPILVQSITLAFAAMLASGTIRRLFWCVLAASLSCLLVAVVLGDLYPVVLIVQAQLWRAVWLLALFGVVAMVFCVSRLWAEGIGGRVALALFAIGWLSVNLVSSAMLCFLALVYYRFRDFLPPEKAKWVAYGCWAAAAVSVIGEASVHAYNIFGAWREAPEGAFDLTYALTSSALLRTPAMVLALMWVASNYRISTRAAVGPMVALVVLTLATWNGGTDYIRALTSNKHSPELESMVAAHPGEVLWVGESEAPWVWLERGNWVSNLQAGGTVFSRPLAMMWRDRILALLDVDWISPRVFRGWLPHISSERAAPGFTRERIGKICARPDAPAWILGGLESPDALPSDVVAQIWRSPPKFFEKTENGSEVWRKIQNVAVIDCSLYGAKAPE
ncbi:MAG: hypothetical protein WB816_06110 [Methylocystis sp.]